MKKAKELQRKREKQQEMFNDENVKLLTDEELNMVAGGSLCECGILPNGACRVCD